MYLHRIEQSGYDYSQPQSAPLQHSNVLIDPTPYRMNFQSGVSLSMREDRFAQREPAATVQEEKRTTRGLPCRVVLGNSSRAEDLKPYKGWLTKVERERSDQNPVSFSSLYSVIFNLLYADGFTYDRTIPSHLPIRFLSAGSRTSPIHYPRPRIVL